MDDDHYQVLGVSPDASPDEIKRAYKKRALAFHPDRRPGTTAEVVLRRINDAYAVLRDPEQREHYDWLLKQRAAAQPSPAARKADSARRSTSPPRGAHQPPPAHPAAAPGDEDLEREDDVERWRREGRRRHVHQRRTAAAIRKAGGEHVADHAAAMRDLERAWDDERRPTASRRRGTWAVVGLFVVALAGLLYALTP